MEKYALNKMYDKGGDAALGGCGQRDGAVPERGDVAPQFKIVVTNTGNVPLTNVDVTDSVYGTISLDGTLAVGRARSTS